MTWKPKVITFQIIAKAIPNNTKIHIPIEGFEVIRMLELAKLYFAFRFIWYTHIAV